MTDNVVQLKTGPEERRKPVMEILMSVRAGETDFYFMTPEYESLLESLKQTVDNAGEVGLVCGPQGSGRTSMLRRFVKQYGLEWDLCVLQPRHVIGEKLLIEHVSSSFFRRRKVTADELLGQFVEAGELLRHPVVLIDDAQNLSSFALDILLSLKCKLEKYGVHLSVLLFADDTIHATLSTPSLIKYDTLIRRFDMPALSEQQSWEYLHHWLEAHDLDDSRFRLSVTMAHSIHHRGRGLPAFMNYLIARKVEQQFSDRPWMKWRKRLADPKGIMTLSIALFTLLIIAAVFNRGTDTTVSGPLSSPPALSTALVDIARMQQDETSAPGTDSQDSAGEDSRKQAQEQPSANSKAMQTPVAKAGAGGTINRKQAVAAATPDHATPQPATEKALAPQPAEKKTDTAAAEENVDASGPRAEPVLGNDWLLKQPSGHYTIQLAASDSEAAIRNFVSKQPAQDDLYYLHVRRRGGNWFIVVLGSYSKVIDARDKLDRLPASIRKNDPWVRSVSAIQRLVPQPEAEPEQAATVVTETETTMPDAEPADQADSGDAATEAVVNAPTAAGEATDQNGPESSSSPQPTLPVTTEPGADGQ